MLRSTRCHRFQIPHGTAYDLRVEFYNKSKYKTDEGDCDFRRKWRPQMTPLSFVSVVLASVLVAVVI